MKGICLCGGSGTRLYPITKGVSKQLIPIYDKPMCYYPLSVLMLAGIQDILIISTPEDIDSFKRLLGDGSQYGLNLQYAVQPKPEGIAQAFIIGKEFLNGDSVCLVLGDNIFYGAGFSELLMDAKMDTEGIWQRQQGKPDANVFGYYVNDPQRYGVAVFNNDGDCIGIEEKPSEPKSNYAVVGLYFYPSDVVEKVMELKPSARGELEITSLNQMYINEGRLSMNILPRGFSWLDTGTFQSLSEASNFVEAIENRTGIHIACLEEIAYRNDWISLDDLLSLGNKLSNNDYGKYLLNLYRVEVEAINATNSAKRKDAIEM